MNQVAVLSVYRPRECQAVCLNGYVILIADGHGGAVQEVAENLAALYGLEIERFGLTTKDKVRWASIISQMQEAGTLMRDGKFNRLASSEAEFQRQCARLSKDIDEFDVEGDEISFMILDDVTYLLNLPYLGPVMVASEQTTNSLDNVRLDCIQPCEVAQCSNDEFESLIDVLRKCRYGCMRAPLSPELKTVLIDLIES